MVADGNLPFAPKCALAVDVSAPDMLGDNRALFEACEARAVLDHHESNPFFGQVNHVEPDRAAAGEMALLLIEALGVALTKDMASCLFAAISSDTGNFNYSNTTAETFEAAAACVRAGADVDEITGCIYRTRTEARTRLLGLVLAELHREGKVAWACVTNAMFERAGALRCDTERIVNYLIEIEGVEIAALAIGAGGRRFGQVLAALRRPLQRRPRRGPAAGRGRPRARRRHHHPPPACRGRGRGALPRAGDRLMDGFLVLNKPLGKTSSDCVVFVRKRLPRGTAIGHGGTLDPMASGVLPVCVGAATRLFDYIIDKQKTYVAELQLGVVTDTQDATGAVVETTERERHRGGRARRAAPLHRRYMANAAHVLGHQARRQAAVRTGAARRERGSGPARLPRGRRAPHRLAGRRPLPAGSGLRQGRLHPHALPRHRRVSGLRRPYGDA